MKSDTFLFHFTHDKNQLLYSEHMLYVPPAHMLYVSHLVAMLVSRQTALVPQRSSQANLISLDRAQKCKNGGASNSDIPKGSWNVLSKNI